jgi:hypothetical protein
VFLCLDKADAKRAILEYLTSRGTPFIDLGLGLDVDEGMLGGQVSTTTATAAKTNHIEARVPLVDGDAEDIYGKNIQIADLNALNAALAVIRWKKLFGFYNDLGHEHFSLYTIRHNSLINEEIA